MLCTNRFLALLAIGRGSIRAIVLEQETSFLVADSRSMALIDDIAPASSSLPPLLFLTKLNLDRER